MFLLGKNDNDFGSLVHQIFFKLFSSMGYWDHTYHFKKQNWSGVEIDIGMETVEKHCVLEYDSISQRGTVK